MNSKEFPTSQDGEKIEYLVEKAPYTLLLQVLWKGLYDIS